MSAHQRERHLQPVAARTGGDDSALEGRILGIEGGAALEPENRLGHLLEVQEHEALALVAARPLGPQREHLLRISQRRLRLAQLQVERGAVRVECGVLRGQCNGLLAHGECGGYVACSVVSGGEINCRGASVPFAAKALARLFRSSTLAGGGSIALREMNQARSLQQSFQVFSRPERGLGNHSRL